MTFIEMIQGLDEKHRAYRPVKDWLGYNIITDEDGFIFDCCEGDYYNLCKDDFLATDWILEEIK